MIGNVPADAQLLGHVAAVTWRPRQRQIVGGVTLFNAMRYDVLLGDGFFIDQVQVDSGHYFDPLNREIRKLTSRRQPMIDLSKHRLLER